MAALFDSPSQTPHRRPRSSPHLVFEKEAGCGVPAAHAPSGASPDVSALRQLQGDELSLVSWQRTLPPGLEEQLMEWTKRSSEKFDARVSMPSGDLTAAMRGLADPAREWLTNDVTLLLAGFAQLADARSLRVTFGAVRTDQCRKFHVDFVRYRLVTTYLGPGTEWVPDHAVRREVLDHPPDCPCDANNEIVRDVRAVRHAVAGEVLVMKGARHPSQQGAVHRSPPIQDTGQVRVVLVASTLDGL